LNSFDYHGFAIIPESQELGLFY